MDPYIELVIINVQRFYMALVFSSLKKQYASKIKLGIIQEEDTVTDNGEHRTSLKWWNSRKRKYVVAELTYITERCRLVYRVLNDGQGTTAHRLLFDTISRLSIDMNVVIENRHPSPSIEEKEQATEDLVYEKFQDPT